jgi:hypothetical protein
MIEAAHRNTEANDVAVRRLETEDPLLRQACPFCHRPFEVGDVTKTAPSGPVNRRELARARCGLSYRCGSSTALHADCGDPTGDGLGRYEA